MTVFCHLSTDTGAAAMVGNVVNQGNIILTQSLINGFNSQTATTVARSGSTVTVTKTAHGFRDQSIIAVSGATPSNYNGVWRIALVDADHFTFQITGTPTTPATGTITIKTAPVGPWMSPFSGTNLAVYQMPATSRCALANGTGGAFYRAQNNNLARRIDVRGYETMNAVSAGVNPFPTPVQELNDGVSLNCTDVADATARAYCVVGDDDLGAVYFITQYSAMLSSQGGNSLFMGGHLLESGAVAGNYDVGIVGAGNTLLTNQLFFGAASPRVANVGTYAARRLNIAGSIPTGRTGDGAMGLSTISAGMAPAATAMNFPNENNGAMYLSEIFITNAAGGKIGRMPGLYLLEHVGGLVPFTIIAGTDDLAGRQLLVIPSGVAGSVGLLDITGPWA